MVWTMAFAHTLLPFILGKYGVEDAWCWIGPEDYGLYRFLFLYGEMGLIAVICMYLWLHVSITAVQVTQHTPHQFTNEL
jgi:hypothetical protein